MYKQTTALTKISNLNKTVRIIQGGQGSAKTVSIILIIISQAQNLPSQEITILQAELSKLKKTAILDFIKIMRGFGMWESNRWNKTASIYTFDNDSFIEFLGLDKADVGKGFRRDVVYFNEVNRKGITLDSYVQFASRARIVYADFNPDVNFFMHDEIIPDADTDFLLLTHKDNEYLPNHERKEILKYPIKGFHNPDLPLELLFEESNIKSKYWANKHRVYGLGMVGIIEGVVHPDWELWDQDRFDDMVEYSKVFTVGGMDFGIVHNTAIIKVHIDKVNMKIYLHEIAYAPNMITDDMAKVIRKHFERIIVSSDHAEPRTIGDLRGRLGLLNVVKCPKKQIVSDLRRINGYELIIRKGSDNLVREIKEYRRPIVDGKVIDELPIDINNDAMAAMRYGIIYGLNQLR